MIEMTPNIEYRNLIVLEELTQFQLKFSNIITNEITVLIGTNFMINRCILNQNSTFQKLNLGKTILKYLENKVKIN